MTHDSTLKTQHTLYTNDVKLDVVHVVGIFSERFESRKYMTCQCDAKHGYKIKDACTNSYSFTFNNKLIAIFRTNTYPFIDAKLNRLKLSFKNDLTSHMEHFMSVWLIKFINLNVNTSLECSSASDKSIALKSITKCPWTPCRTKNKRKYKISN